MVDWKKERKGLKTEKGKTGLYDLDTPWHDLALYFSFSHFRFYKALVGFCISYPSLSFSLSPHDETASMILQDIGYIVYRERQKTECIINSFICAPFRVIVCLSLVLNVCSVLPVAVS